MPFGRYILVNKTVDPWVIETVMVWNGVDPYTPPPGWEVQPQTDPTTQYSGCQYINGVWTPPEPPPPPEE